jgi:hypothetical protein
MEVVSFQDIQFSQRALIYVIVITATITITSILFKTPLNYLLEVWASPVILVEKSSEGESSRSSTESERKTRRRQQNQKSSKSWALLGTS